MDSTNWKALYIKGLIQQEINFCKIRNLKNNADSFKYYQFIENKLVIYSFLSVLVINTNDYSS